MKSYENLTSKLHHSMNLSATEKNYQTQIFSALFSKLDSALFLIVLRQELETVTQKTLAGAWSVYNCDAIWRK